MKNILFEVNIYNNIRMSAVSHDYIIECAK